MDPNVQPPDSQIVSSDPNGDWKNAHASELNTLNQLGSKNRETLINFGAEYVLNPDGTPLLDHMNNPIPIAKMLATKPLKCELASRPGPGNKRLTYVSGDSVTRTLNDIFGFDGWCLEIKSTTREECVQDDKGRFHVTYTAFVRVTHRRSGAFKEDCGSGDAIDKAMGIAISHALKASVTDAMKRAVRHFGDKLGNSLYQDAFNINKAPQTLTEALDMYEVERANTKFGFKNDKDVKIAAGSITNGSATTGSTVPFDSRNLHPGMNNPVNIKPNLPTTAGIPTAAAPSAARATTTTATGNTYHGPSSTNTVATNSSTVQPRSVESTTAMVGQKENIQFASNNSNAPAPVHNQTVGLQRFRQQPNAEMTHMDNSQKLYASKLPPTSLQQLQESSSLSNIFNEGIINDGYTRVVPTTASAASCIPQTKINHVNNPVRSDLLGLDASSRPRLSLPSSISNSMQNESEIMNKKRLQDEADPTNSSGPCKRINPYHSSKNSAELPS